MVLLLVLARVSSSRAQRRRLRGQSRIVDSDGSVLGQLGEDEGVLTADVLMDPARKHYDAQPSFGGWLQPGPWAGRHVIIPLDIAGGRLSYAVSRQRRRKARAATERTNDPAGMTVRPGPVPYPGGNGQV